MTPPAPPPVDNAAARLAVARMTTLLQLQRRCRRAARGELPFVFVNETKLLSNYRQAAFWRIGAGGRFVVEAVSGLAVPDRSAPYVRWLGALAEQARKSGAATSAHALRSPNADGPPPAPDDNAAPATEAKASVPEALRDWDAWLPEHGWWMPFIAEGRLLGALALFRERPFPPAETELLSYLVDAYAQAWALSQTKLRRPVATRRWPWVAAALLLAAGLAYPTRPSALAPGEVVPKRPEIVRSTLDGVVDRFFVEPNQAVAKGEPLLALEDTQLRTRLLVARKAEEMAEAEYRQLQKSALSDARSKALMTLTRGKVEQLAAERAYVESLLARVVVSGATDGVALFERPDEWVGRPVNQGQKILLVADPAEVELEIGLPVAEALELALGDRVLFFPNVSPGDPIEGRLSYIGHRAQEAPGTGMVFRLRAEFADGAAPLLGQRGTVKLSGGRERPLALVILRRPLAAVRQWLGR